MKKKIIIPILFTIMLFSIVINVNAADCSSYKKQDKCESGGCKWTTLTSRRGECVTNCSSYKNQSKCEDAGCKWTTLTSRRGECVLKTSSDKAAEDSGTTKKSSGSRLVSCGNINGIPRKIPQLTSYIITVMQVAATVILVLLGTIDLFKGITSSKEEEMKKGQQTFVKRLITGALIFFVVLIVKLLVGAVADASSSNIVSCMDCFISDDCD